MTNPIRVLGIDGGNSDRELVCDVFRGRDGFILTEIASRSGLRKTFAKGKFDVVLCDTDVLGFEGLKILDVIRAVDESIPVILVTGSGSEELAVMAFKSGVADYVRKTPRALRDLPETIRTVLEKAKLRERQSRLLESLRESEKRHLSLLDDILDASRVGVFTLDNEFKVVWVNKAMERFFGMQREDVLGKDKRCLIRERIKHIFEDPEAFASKVLATYDDNTYMKNFEGHVLPGPGRKERWLEHWSQPIYSGYYAGGRIEHYYDITELKRMEEELRLSEAWFRKLAEASPTAIFISRGNRFTYVNREVEGVLGYGREELLKMRYIWDVVHPDFREMVRQRARARLRGKSQPGRYEFKVLTKDGSEKWIEFSADTIDWNGEPAVIGTAFDITKRKQAEEALRESEDRYRDLVEHSRDLMSTHDLKGHILSVNRAVIQSLGYSAEELLQMNIRDILVPLARKDLDGYLEKVRRQGKAKELMSVCTKKGEKRVWAYHNTLRTEGVAEPVVRAMARDITERFQAEAKLKEESARLQAITNAANDAIIMIDSRRDITFWNPAAERILGYSREEAIGKNLHKLVVPGRYYSLFVNKFNRFRKTGEGNVLGKTIELEAKRKDGMVISVDISLSALKRPDGWHAVGILRDVTERKRVAEERERLMTAIEQTDDAIVITDPEGTIQYVNPAFERVTGYSEREVLGENPRVLKSGNHDCPFYENLWLTIKSGKTWQGRFVNRRKDGSHYVEAATISPVHDASGKIINYVAVKKDVTERLKIEEELRQAQKMESIGRLAGGVAHDYNNMLGVILGYTELAMSKVTPDHSLYGSLRQIQAAAQHSADITSKLLAFARRQTVEPRIISLNETVKGIFLMLRRLIGEDLDLTFEPTPGLWLIKMDPTQVDRVLTNLVVNARDAISGMGKIAIKTANVSMGPKECSFHTDCVPGDFVMVSVADNGRGMDATTLESVFEPFFTTKKAGKGTGMGLATVYGIVKQNGGFIHVSSELGKGSTFTIYLPRYAGVEPEPNRERGLVGIPPGHGETLLVVEDEPALLQLVQTTLSALGYRVFAARTPTEALRIVEAHINDIQLLVTDIIMPEMTGWELANRMGKGNLSPVLKILFISGYPAEIITRRGILMEGMNFLQKPFSAKDLAVKVRETLGNE